MALEVAQSDVLQQLGVSYPQLIDYSSEAYTAILVQVCTLVLITWDYITTFDGEMAFFWQAERRSRWSVARILFMLNRYFPISVFSVHVYWRVNRSLDNPLCTTRVFINYSAIPIYVTIEILQMLRVWAMFNRSWGASLVLLALFAFGTTTSTLAWTLQNLWNPSFLPLAPESFVRCQHGRTQGFYACVSSMIVQTILMAMVILKVRKSCNNIRSMPLFRALLLDGTIYYAVFILAFSLDIIASANSKLYYPIVDTHFVFCANVIACNHLMLYLREVARGPTSTEPLSYSLSRPITNVAFTRHDSGVAYSYDDRSLPDSAKQTSGVELRAETRYIT